ncbi:hypothetical protein BRADI_2g44851v3 [Brachypodium distachyon]|uniref:Uncharacterized protein n=1 Tax=Brachypodium distachyon TaxID=15368 RepID=A0A2K2DDW9_BRADI|nr:hypothetical protein BRADI_2g44851v3 [Brachypodium distachyon]
MDLALEHMKKNMIDKFQTFKDTHPCRHTSIGR